MRLPLLAALLLIAPPAAADTRTLFEKAVNLVEFSAGIKNDSPPKTVYGPGDDGCDADAHCSASIGDATITSTPERLLFKAGSEMIPGARLYPCAGLAGELTGLGPMVGAQLGLLYNKAKADGGEASEAMGKVRVTAIVTDGLIGGCAFDLGPIG